MYIEREIYMKTGRPTKQIIVMRTDTNPPMRKGKMVAQGAHASIAFLSRRLDSGEKLTPAMKEWMNDSYKKVCVRVDSEQELLDIYQKAKDAMVEVHLVTDSGKTEFSEPTKTCLAIGPDYDERIDPITSHLKLL